jgi:hypothetical protein
MANGAVKLTRFGTCSKSLEYEVMRKAYRIRNFRKPVAVIVGCQFNQYKGIAVNHPYMTYKQLIVELDYRLLRKLKILGPLARKRNNNYLGNCAEVHASNKVLKQTPIIELDQIVFSLAYRPRTLQVIDYCQNCLDTFNISN